ncbi:hypothetical protein F1C16_00410 [Hymenobacter sp. NBH84]|nr:hypothetical protein F1C16_00410 [Hymenobacter sp. NBH84]
MMVYRWRGFWLCLSLLFSTLTVVAQTPPADTVQTASGLRYLVATPGTGPTPQPGDKLVVEYSGFLPSGKVFDSSAVDGHPLRLRVGRGEVIKGWDEVLLLLPAGTRARVWIPAALAYGAKGARDPDDDSRYLIPPNTDLVFDLTVVKVR